MGIPCSAVSKVTTSLEYGLSVFPLRLEQTKGALEPSAALAPASLLALPLRCSTCSPGSTAQREAAPPPGQGEATCGITPDSCFCQGVGSRGGAEPSAESFRANSRRGGTLRTR